MVIESTLLPQIGSYIAGRWITGRSGNTFAVLNPATGEHLADVPRLSEAQVVEAVEAAQAAWALPTSPSERRGWLTGIAAALREHAQELARIITLEHGKPLPESTAEVEYAAGFFAFFAERLDVLESSVLPDRPRDLPWTVHHRPAGVAGLIAPWNFPLAMLAKKLAAALGAGCGMVSKPSTQAPLAAIALHGLIERLGIPAGRVNLVTGDASVIGSALCSHPAVRVISFTGSTQVGKLLASQAAPYLKRMSLELGGNAPFIVFPDADLEAAASALLANKFRAGGQTCVCTNRVLVHREVMHRFGELVAERTARLKVGNGLDAGIDVGPLIDRNGFDKVAAHVQDALRRGAQRLVGGDPPRPSTSWGAFYPPTVLMGVTPEMLVCREETFGPVVAIGPFNDEGDAIRLANGTSFGLAAYVFTGDLARGARVVASLQFGHVGLNTATGPVPEAPFGGMKESGFGREGGVEGLLEFCETQVVAGG